MGKRREVRKMKLKKHEVGMAMGLMLATWHALWAAMVFLGLAQPFLNWIFLIHSIANPYQVLPFNLVRSVTLVVVTFVIGYFVGWLFAMIWKKVTK